MFGYAREETYTSLVIVVGAVHNDPGPWFIMFEARSKFLELNWPVRPEEWFDARMAPDSRSVWMASRKSGKIKKNRKIVLRRLREATIKRNIGQGTREASYKVKYKNCNLKPCTPRAYPNFVDCIRDVHMTGHSPRDPVSG